MKKAASKRSRPPKKITVEPKEEVKPDSYFTATKILVRHIEPHHLSGKRPRVIGAAFSRGFGTKDGKIEDYLSVNCEGLDNLDEILDFYFRSWGHSPTYYIRHKVEKINAAANSVKSSTISYDADAECYCFSSGTGPGKAAYSHKPKGNGESYSHSGIMFYSALGELGELEFADALTMDVKPSKRHPNTAKKRTKSAT